MDKWVQFWVICQCWPLSHKKEMHNRWWCIEDRIPWLDDIDYWIELIRNKSEQDSMATIFLRHELPPWRFGKVHNKQFKRIKHKRLIPIKSKAINGLLPSISNIKTYNIMPYSIRSLRPSHGKLYISALNIIISTQSYIYYVEFWVQVVCLYDSVCDYWHYWKCWEFFIVVLSLLCCLIKKGD